VIDLVPHHQHLAFMSPLSGQRAASLVNFLKAHARGTVVDIGCGWAGLLTRLLVASPELRGLGLDLKADGFAHARSVAQKQGVADRLELVAGDAKLHLPASAQGAICIGASQVWAPHGEQSPPLDCAAALKALRHLLPSGAPLVYGEAIWSVPPTPAAIAPLGGRLDEFLFLPDLVDLAWASGFAVVQVQQASLDEWDEFESGYTARYAVWLAEQGASHPDFDEVRERAFRQRDAYFRGYRGVLGMAYLALLAV
jgi:SAM-dependent methyltransferase